MSVTKVQVVGVHEVTRCGVLMLMCSFISTKCVTSYNTATQVTICHVVSDMSVSKVVSTDGAGLDTLHQSLLML